MLDKFDGLRNTVDPERLSPSELSRARNIDLDDRGQPHRRRGFALVDGAPYHSLFSTSKGSPLGVRNGVFGKINPDFSFMPFGGNSTVGQNHLAYAQVGDTLYLSSRSASGKLVLNQLPSVVQPWGVRGGDRFWYSPVVHPDNAQLIPAVTGGFDDVYRAAAGLTDPTLPPIGGKLLGNVPLADKLTYYNGRIYAAMGKLLWATELYLYDYIDATKNFRHYESDITALATVQDGIYVGTKQNLWFVSGTFNESTQVLAAAGGIVPGSVSYVPEHLISPQTQAGQGELIQNKQAVVMMTDSSMIVCLSGGQTFDMTRDKYILPPAQWATTLFRAQDGINSIVAVQNSGGDPANSARFGDYVSVQLVRNGVPVYD